MNEKKKIITFKPIKNDYSKIAYDYLTMYAISKLEKLNIALSYTNIVIASFKLFPDKFSLSGYADYPDAYRTHLSLWHCRDKDKAWLVGADRHGYTITVKGRKKGIDVAFLLIDKKIAHDKKDMATNRQEEKLLKGIRLSDTFKKYREGRKGDISKFEFCDIVQCTLDSAPNIMRTNLDSLEIYANESKSEDILKFLQWLRKQFKEMLNVKVKVKR